MIRVSAWTAVFLVLLRVCIGWHFAYEGLTKVKSAYTGKAAANEKVFTSENYFRESEGPFGKLVKSRIGDPDQELVARLTPNPVDGDTSRADPKDRFPAALAPEWDGYFDRFVATYRLDEGTKARAQAQFDQSKAEFVNWLQGFGKLGPDGKPTRVVLKVKHKAPGTNNASADYDQEMTVAERAAELRAKSEEVRTAYQKMAEMGKDVDAVALRAKKADVNAIRSELQKELDDQTKAMKDGLAKLLEPRTTAYAAQVDNKEPATTVEEMLKPMAGGENPLGKMWDEYAAYVKDFALGVSDEQKGRIDQEVQAAKDRFDRWLADQDPYTGQPVADKPVAEWKRLYADARGRKALADRLVPVPKTKDDKPPPAPELAALPAFMPAILEGTRKDADEEMMILTSRMQAELKTQSDSMRAQVGTPLLGEDRVKGYAPADGGNFLFLFPRQWGLIDYLDWSTRWFLLVVGILLMVGLFTRFACFSAAGFLLLTVLTQLSVPWLPAAPTSEGSYLFVNKNAIEMVALLALMTTRSGQWAGLDAIVCWCCGCRRRA